VIEQEHRHEEQQCEQQLHARQCPDARDAGAPDEPARWVSIAWQSGAARSAARAGTAIAGHRALAA
jgi:hypothetical protein